MSSKHSVRGDPYSWQYGPASHERILHNNFDIKNKKVLAAVETDFAMDRMDDLLKSPIKGDLDLKHLQAIHKALFKDVYPTKRDGHIPAMAGAIRTVGISKSTDVEKGIDFPHPDDSFDGLKPRLKYAFDQIKSDQYLKGLRDNPSAIREKFSKHVAEVWEAHPFRDGNTRTTYLYGHHLITNARYTFKHDAEVATKFRSALEDYVTGDKSPLHALADKMISPENPKIKQPLNKQTITI